MVLKEQELLQIDEKFIRRLLEKDPDALAELSIHSPREIKGRFMMPLMIFSERRKRTTSTG